MVYRDDSTVHQPGSTIHTFKKLLLVVSLLLVDGGGSTTGGGMVVPTGVLESILFAEKLYLWTESLTHNVPRSMVMK
jgi:hypothetical protein